MTAITPLRLLVPVTAALSLARPDVLPSEAKVHQAQAPRPGTIFLYPERVPLQDGSLADAERGLLFVPLQRSDTAQGVVAVEVWRFRARMPSALPPVFRLPGGPGFEGLEGPLSRGYYEDVVQAYTAFTDYVVVGQRGIGPSKPNTLCASSRLGVTAYAEQCRDYWRGKGLRLAGFNVIEAAADVADLARALGYERIVLRGGSFGSHWAMAVMRYHPGLVAWALLSGTEGPNHTYDSPTAVLNALKRVAADAERSPALAPLIPQGGLIAALERVRQRLGRAPVTVSVTDSATGTAQTLEFTERDASGFALGYTSALGSRRGAATWPADILRLYYGDFETVARLRARRMARPQGPESYSTASSYTLDCASGSTAERLDRLKADPARALVGEEFSWYEEICAPWGVDAGDEFRSRLITDIPTVIVHGTWDVNTPLENALEVAPGFRRGKLVTVVGGSHGALGEAMDHDPGFAAVIWQFLRTGDPSALPDAVVLPPLDWVVTDALRNLAARAATGRQ